MVVLTCRHHLDDQNFFLFVDFFPKQRAQTEIIVHRPTSSEFVQECLDPVSLFRWVFSGSLLITAFVAQCNMRRRCLKPTPSLSLSLLLSPPAALPPSVCHTHRHHCLHPTWILHPTSYILNPPFPIPHPTIYNRRTVLFTVPLYSQTCGALKQGLHYITYGPVDRDYRSRWH